jgi:perosamine synthetase
MEPIPMASPVIGDEEVAAVEAVLRSGQLSLGPRVPQFEQDFAAAVGARHASAVSSGTTGLHLAIRAAGVTDGAEVITSPFSFVATSNVVLYERAKPVFVDIDPETFCIPADAVSAAVTDRTAALLPVHIFGNAADIENMEPLGIPIVEDAAQALGTRYADGTPVGSRGHMAIFAFYPNKQMTTGEGGVVVTGDEANKERLDSERNQGRAPDMGWLDHDRLGFNYRLSDIACALGIEQLKRVDDLLARRARVAELYTQALQGVEGLNLPAARDSWFVYVVQVPPGTDRDETIVALRERGIASKPYLPAIHLFTFYQELGYRKGEFPVAEDIGARSLALPFFPQMTEGQVARVAEALGAVLSRTAA